MGMDHTTRLPSGLSAAPCPCRPSTKLSFVDHVVGNQPDLQMVPVADW